MSINEISNPASFICYPNPANNFLNINSKGFTGNMKVQIFDALGRNVFKDHWTSNYLENKNQINISHFENGLYIIQISDDYQTKSKRFFINSNVIFEYRKNTL